MLYPHLKRAWPSSGGGFTPTLNLDQAGPRCAPLDYVRGDGNVLDCEYTMSNNIAFGGINTSLIFKRWD